MYTLNTQNRAITLDVPAEQLSAVEGLALAARFTGWKYTLTDNAGKDVADEFKMVSELTTDSMNFAEGYRFSLLNAEKLRIYYTKDPHVIGGVQLFINKFACGSSPTMMLADIIKFTVTGPVVVSQPVTTNRDLTIQIYPSAESKESKIYRLIFDADKQAVNLLFNDVSLVHGKLDYLLTHRGFMDELSLKLDSATLGFLRQMILTAGCGLTDSPVVRVTDAGIQLAKGAGWASIPQADLDADTVGGYLQDLLS